MNIKGIELLRKIGSPAPNKEIICRDLRTVNLDSLYSEAEHGATILAFDYTEPINQNSLLEKEVRQYGIERRKYFEAAERLIWKLSRKKVARENMMFLTHQTYTPNDIAYCGRVGIDKNKEGFGSVMIDAINSLRIAHGDFNPKFVYKCPVIGDRIFKSKEKFLRDKVELPAELRSRLIGDVYRIPGNPYIDFEVYKNGRLFYHDMFLSQKDNLN